MASRLRPGFEVRNVRFSRDFSSFLESAQGIGWMVRDRAAREQEIARDQATRQSGKEPELYQFAAIWVL